MSNQTYAQTLVAMSDKRQRFFGHIRATSVLPQHHLIRIIRAASQYSTAVREAALRNLVANSPVEVTQGRPFSERRRLVRKHFNV